MDNLSALNQQWTATLAQHRTKIGWVWLHRVYAVRDRPTRQNDSLASIVWMLAAEAMVVEGINIEDIF